MKNDRHLPTFADLLEDAIARELGLERLPGLSEGAWRRVRGALMDSHPDAERIGNRIEAEWKAAFPED